MPAVVALILLARLAPAEASVPAMGRLGQAHILLATLGVAVFAFAAVLAIVYLFQDRSLKRKQLDRARRAERRWRRWIGWRTAASRSASRCSRWRS